MPVGTSGGLPEFQFFIKSTPDALRKAGFSQMAGLSGLLFFWGFDDENTISIRQFSGLKTEASFFGFLFQVLSKRENQI